MGGYSSRPVILRKKTLNPDGTEEITSINPLDGRPQTITVAPRPKPRSWFFGFGGKRKTRRSKTVRTVRMKKGEYLREHHHLFRVLQNPTRRALNAELRAQKRELKERGLRG